MGQMSSHSLNMDAQYLQVSTGSELEIKFLRVGVEKAFVSYYLLMFNFYVRDCINHA